jgi:hypothetical protein
VNRDTSEENHKKRHPFYGFKKAGEKVAFTHTVEKVIIGDWRLVLISFAVKEQGGKNTYYKVEYEEKQDHYTERIEVVVI